MADGTKSTDHEVPAKKKRVSRSVKKATTSKRKSVRDKSGAKSKGKGKSAAATGNKKGGKQPQSDADDLDIESNEASEQEVSQVEDSDWEERQVLP